VSLLQAARQSGGKLLAAVVGLHCCGFAIGYGASRALGLSEKISRTNSIEVCGRRGREGQQDQQHWSKRRGIGLWAESRSPWDQHGGKQAIGVGVRGNGAQK